MNIDNVIVRLVELCLREIGKQAFVAAMAVDDENFSAAVAGHFVGGFLQKIQLNLPTVGDGAGFVLGFEDLPEIIFRENNGEFFFRGVQRGVANVDQIGAEGKMRAVLFQNAEGEDAGALGKFDGVVKMVA